MDMLCEGSLSIFFDIDLSFGWWGLRLLHTTHIYCYNVFVMKFLDCLITWYLDTYLVNDHAISYSDSYFLVETLSCIFP